MAVTSTRSVQPRRWLEAPNGWDTTWRTAKTSATAPANVAVIGDSDALGYSSTNWMTKAWPMLLRNSLVTKYGSYADYYPVSLSSRYGGSTAAGTPPWTLDTTFGTGTMNLFGLGPTIFQDTATFPLAWNNAGSASFLTPYACTAFDIIWHDYNTTGTWKYSVDNAAGAGLVTVTAGAFNSMRRIAVGGQTSAAHTIRFGGGSIANALGLSGIVTYNPATTNRGIGFANVSAASFRMYDWLVSNNQSPVDRIAQWQGRYKTAAATEVMTGFGFPTQPHLAIIELGIVDSNVNVGLTQFRVGLRKMCDALRRGQDGCSIMFVICPNPSPATSDITTGFARPESWSLYADQIYGVAAEYQAAVANFHADWMSTPVAQGLVGATDPHPTDAGHQAIADVLSPILL